MTGLSTLLVRARADVNSCIGIWTELLEERFSDIIEYAYSKGSAVKRWDSEIDYVPLLSDVDIHFRIRDGTRAFRDRNQGLAMAMDTGSEYELRFRQRNSKHLHLPRTQLILLNDLEKDPFYVPPRLDDVHIMLGELSKKTLPSNDRVREIDLAQLDLLGPYLETLPMSAVDRTGLDWWTLVRQMGWRVSPSPVRLLSQVYEEPLDVWSWNRTRLCRELKGCGNNEIETSYREFYLAGWQLFQYGLKDPERFRLVVSKGYDVLAGCYRASRPK